MPGWLGPWELLIILFVILLVFGPKRLPQAGRALGRGLREFKDSVTGKDERPDETPAELPPAQQDQGTPRQPPASSREHDTVG